MVEIIETLETDTLDQYILAAMDTGIMPLCLQMTENIFRKTVEIYAPLMEFKSDGKAFYRDLPIYLLADSEEIPEGYILVTGPRLRHE